MVGVQGEMLYLELFWPGSVKILSNEIYLDILWMGQRYLLEACSDQLAAVTRWTWGRIHNTLCLQGNKLQVNWLATLALTNWWALCLWLNMKLSNWRIFRGCNTLCVDLRTQRINSELTILNEIHRLEPRQTLRTLI